MIEREETSEVTVVVDGHIATPQGFRAGAVACGLKKDGRFDLGAIVCDAVADAAAVFTTNVVQAAPLIATQQGLRQQNGRVRSVIVNSGNANACTGEQGWEDARSMQRVWGRVWDTEESLIAVASTGVIGVPLPMDRVHQGIEQLGVLLHDQADEQTARQFVESIMTTDTYAKSICVTVEVEGRPVTISGVAKGSGMIHPNMATMLAFITTDAYMGEGQLLPLLQAVTDDTFNMITVDGDTSTNDFVLVMASRRAHVRPLTPQHEAWASFVTAFRHVATHLAKAIARDGEGATKLLAIHVSQAEDDVAARVIAKTIAGSNLVKSAMYGADANWGRVLAAAGRAGVVFDPTQVSVSLGTDVVLRSGVPEMFDEARVKSYLLGELIDVYVSLGGDGSGRATAWGCDLTYDYVKINASYRS